MISPPIPYLQLSQVCLLCAAKAGPSPARVYLSFYHRIVECATSPHVQVAHASLALLSDSVVIDTLLRPCATVSAGVAAALRTNRGMHWCPSVVHASEDLLRRLQALGLAPPL